MQLFKSSLHGVDNRLSHQSQSSISLSAGKQQEGVRVLGMFTMDLKFESRTRTLISRSLM